MLTRVLLRTLRNELPMAITLQNLGDAAPYSKCIDGQLRFICTHCGELLATVNPRNNLAHCFNCMRNTNNIDLLINAGYGFLKAVELLQLWLRQYRQNRAAQKEPASAHQPGPIEKPSNGAVAIGQLLRSEFGNPGPSSARAP